MMRHLTIALFTAICVILPARGGSVIYCPDEQAVCNPMISELVLDMGCYQTGDYCCHMKMYRYKCQNDVDWRYITHYYLTYQACMTYSGGETHCTDYVDP